MFPAIWHECCHATGQPLHDIIFYNPDHVVSPIWPHMGNEAEAQLILLVWSEQVWVWVFPGTDR